MISRANVVAALLSLAVFSALSLQVTPVLAQSTDDASQTASELQRQIDEQSAQITQLDKEIAQYQKELDAVGTKKKTLQNDLNELNLLLKKSAASISATQKKITSTQLQIKQLAKGMAVKQDSIDTDVAGLAESFRKVNEADATSLAVRILASPDPPAPPPGIHS